ncbi:MAG TPA: hypothetical protein VGH15_05125 [Caulobacteraceae bacterium]|jgi:hypothetical protein
MSDAPIHADPDGPEVRPRRTGQGRIDLVLAISAIFISGVSLFVAIEHGKTERDLVAASSWPFLQEISSNVWDNGRALAIGFGNSGVGPAKVKFLEVFYAGAPVRSSLDLLRRCCGLAADAVGASAQIRHGLLKSVADETVIRAGENNPVMLLQRARAAPVVASRFDDALRRITFRACYCSILDECWLSDLRSTRTHPVKVCPAPDHPFDPNGE